MTAHHDDDDRAHLAGDASWNLATSSMEAIAPATGSPLRFDNISPKVVLRVDPPMLAAGSIVGSYRLVQQIGSGGMGSVFEAVHSMLPRRVAIKVMHGQLRGDSGMDTRMVQEATILDQLCHPGVARVFDCGVLHDGRPWIAMELIAGESLASKLARDTRLQPDEVCKLVAAVADVLATVHPRGIVHRDLKPDNILFAEAESGFPLRVIDWGVARLGAHAKLTLDGVTCGTPVYMSPEQAAGRDIAPACDIYSLGIIAYEALTGFAPFEGRTLADVVALQLHGEAVALASLCPAAPAELCALIHEMLHKTPSARPSAAAVRQRMQRFATELLESESEFESYSVTAAATLPPPSVDGPVRLHPPRWTPETSMSEGSGYMLIRPLDAGDQAAGEVWWKR